MGVMNGPELAEKKRALRKAARATRKAQREAAGEAEWEAMANQMAAHALDMVRHLAPGGGRITSYEAIGNEPPTEAMNEALVAAGYEVLVPITLEDLDLEWRLLESCTSLGKEAIGTATVVLTPGTLVDGVGGRLGQGGGCYDRSLPRRAPDVKVVTVVFDHEVVDDPLPKAEHDLLVDGYLTPGGWRLFDP